MITPSHLTMYYARANGRTVGVYANDKHDALRKFNSQNFKIESKIVSVDEWLSR